MKVDFWQSIHRIVAESDYNNLSDSYIIVGGELDYFYFKAPIMPGTFNIDSVEGDAFYLNDGIFPKPMATYLSTKDNIDTYTLQYDEATAVYFQFPHTRK